MYGHFVPGADRHHVEGLAEAIEEAAMAKTQPPRNQSPPSSDSLLRKFSL